MPIFETPRPIQVAVDLTVGDVHLTASDTTTTVVEVVPRTPSDRRDVEAAEATAIELSEGRLVVKGPRSPLRSWFTTSVGGAVAVTIEVPAGSLVAASVQLGALECAGVVGDVRAKTGMGAIHLEEAGTVSLKTGMGEIAAERVHGDADVVSGSGEVRLGRVGGRASVKSANGDTHIADARGAVRVSAGNGGITIDRADADVQAKSAFGAVRVGEVARGDVELQTQAGDLDIGIREGVAAWLDLRVAAGRVHSSLERADAPTPEAGGTVAVRARTSVGDVHVHRA